MEIVLDRRDKTAAIEQARILMTESDGIANDRFRLFYRSYLAMTLLVLQDAGRHLSRRWRLSPLIQLRIASFRKHPTLDSFELRFSVRCAVGAGDFLRGVPCRAHRSPLLVSLSRPFC